MSGKLVIIQPNGVETTEAYTGKRPEYQQLRKAVQGLIETVKVRWEGRVREAYANEEGLNVGMDYNPRASDISSEFGYQGIVGPIVIIVPTPRGK